ncbi:MAG: T9SS type A sorting domain-containing protein [Bacteroidia bacterium]|nr:T9SS type A sorting domain-containing protein [Bacteroidia bacterium]
MKSIHILLGLLLLSLTAAAQPLSLAIEVVPGPGTDTVNVYFRNNTANTLKIGAINLSLMYQSGCNSAGQVVSSAFTPLWGTMLQHTEAAPVCLSYGGVTYTHRWQLGNTNPNFLQPVALQLPGNTTDFVPVAKIVFVNNGCAIQTYLENLSENIANDITDQTGQRITYNVVNNTGTSFPVEWLGFEAYQVGIGANRLEWFTATETNSGRFEVERSTDGVLYTKLGEVAGAGFSNSPRAYQFLDEKAIGEVFYYRLRQVDLDGEFSYSEVRQVRTTADFGYLITLYPNPAVTDIFLTSTADNKTDYQLTITDMGGKTVYSQDLLRLNTLPVRVAVGHLAKGIYQCSLVNPATGRVEARMFQKQ